MNKEIRSWKLREGTIKESVWLSEGIKLFRRLAENDPENIEYKANLAKLLIRSGTDEKLKFINLMNAKRLFEEVVKLLPNSAEALYRLGHICYENMEYEKSIEYFTKAIEFPMSEIRMVRAYLTIAKAYYHLSDDGKSNTYLQKAIEIDTEKNFTSEINEVRSLITEEDYYRRIVRYSDGEQEFLTVKGVKDQRTYDVMDEVAELDLSHFRPTFIGLEDSAHLERREAEILCYLIEQKHKFVSKEELFKVWDEDERPTTKTITSYISTIKRKIRPCLPEDNNEIISSKRGIGYRWISTIPTKITKHL